MTDILIRSGDTHRLKTLRRHREKTAICKPRREASEETNPANTMILDFLPPNCKIINMLFHLSGLWGFVLAALENQQKPNDILFHTHPHMIDSFLNEVSEAQ